MTAAGAFDSFPQSAEDVPSFLRTRFTKLARECRDDPDGEDWTSDVITFIWECVNQESGIYNDPIGGSAWLSCGGRLPTSLKAPARMSPCTLDLRRPDLHQHAGYFPFNTLLRLPPIDRRVNSRS